MSGTGKSTAMERLCGRGHRAVGTDSDRWSHWVTDEDGAADWIRRERAIADLLGDSDGGTLFVAGCKTNQSRFHPVFDHIVLLSAPTEVLPARIAVRTDNPYGKRPEERAAVIHHLDTVEPLLRESATAEIDVGAHTAGVARRVGRTAPGVEGRRQANRPRWVRSRRCSRPQREPAGCGPHDIPARKRVSDSASWAVQPDW
ncbi:hypothetical protein [Embleya scabrispora]|uniref:hypothetical protein n=1 Tax=Embleya scabrispora TaxID=159449 RepID=UPI000D1C9E0B|nr:hypothetical protein [Embleya scabrispora]